MFEETLIQSEEIFSFASRENIVNTPKKEKLSHCVLLKAASNMTLNSFAQTIWMCRTDYIEMENIYEPN